jgi:hypothetical protein
LTRNCNENNEKNGDMMKTIMKNCSQAVGDRQDVVVSEALALLSGMTDAGWVRRRSLLAVLAADSARVKPSTHLIE